MYSKLEILDMIAGNTMAVMLGDPEKRGEFLTAIPLHASLAQDEGDVPMIMLLDAVSKLLTGTSPDSLHPDLEGPYAVCWIRIVRGLQTGEDPLRVAVFAFLNARSWEESRHVVAEQQEYLLSDAVDPVLDELVEQYERDPDRVDYLKTHRSLLERCRREGIDAAFAERSRSPGVAEVPDQLRSLLARLQRLTDPGEMSRRAEVCETALELVDETTHPELWAAVQNELGLSLARNPFGERAEKMEQAIHHYDRALEVYTRDAFPKEWCMIHNNLATAYWSHIHGDRAQNIEKAIQYCQEALEVCTRERFPELWATAQHNLGLVYSDRIRGERAQNVEEAIEHYQQALEVRTREDLPEKWAMTKTNLAGAYQDRVLGERAENIEMAIRHSEDALDVYTRGISPWDWAGIQNNLGNAYMARIRGERSQNIEQAIDHYEQALLERRREIAPREWAVTKTNLGNAYLERIDGERAINVELAIDCYQEALEVLTHDAFPAQWAGIQGNLAGAYSARIDGRRAGDIERAIHHYQLALEIQTIEQFPVDRRRTLCGMGDLYFGERDWQAARSCYGQAIEAGDVLLAAAYTEAGRRAEIGETARSYTRMAYCHLQLGEYGDALLSLEQGKARLLAEALALADADLDALPRAQSQRIREAQQIVRSLEAEMRLSPDTSSRRSDPELAESLSQAHIELDRLVGDVRGEHPGFLVDDLDPRDICALVPDNSALVIPLVTSQGSAMFVIPHGSKTIQEDHIIWLDDFTDAGLQDILVGTEDDPGLLYFYRLFRTIDTTLGESLPANVIRDARGVALTWWSLRFISARGRLWYAMMGAVDERLKELGVERVILIPHRGLQLIPLHAAWGIVDGETRYFIDDYEITYTPSARVLDVCQRRVAERRGREALVVGVNAYEDLLSLANACTEAEAIAATLGTSPLLDADATREAVLQSAPGKAYLHLSCHGAYAWSGNPLASALYLAGDEPLTLAEIVSELDLDSTRLVVLSACETGITDIDQSPDEYVGLSTGFLQAGAPAVVSSLWTVDDRSTALLMERFYKNHLEEAMPPARALREAQLWLRDATRKELGDYYKSHIRMDAADAHAAYARHFIACGDPDDRPYADPFYWAAFTFTGA